jgi:hypothetical protein
MKKTVENRVNISNYYQLLSSEVWLIHSPNKRSTQDNYLLPSITVTHYRLGSHSFMIIDPGPQ